MNKNPRKRAGEVLSVVVDDPDVDATDIDEVLEASLELADELFLGHETRQEIHRLANGATFEIVT